MIRVTAIDDSRSLHPFWFEGASESVMSLASLLLDNFESVVGQKVFG